MKKVLVLLFFIVPALSFAQAIQVIVPRQPVVLGNAFQVQYIIRNPSGLVTVTAPVFEGFRLVSGPNYYKGNTSSDGKMNSIQNITYTLVPSKTGILKVAAIRANFKNLPEQKSDDAYVTVISPPKVSYNTRSSYTDVSLYAPASTSDLQKLVDRNLFIKTSVSRTTCYEGEPIIVTYKLFSRLESSSEAIKAPGLYGFSMIDMVNINEAHQEVKTIDGRVYNTFLLRKMQVYPVQSGKLIIDPMHVQNEIEFNDSIHKNRKIRIEKELQSEPINIIVKPLPGKKPDNFMGAVGQFSIRAWMEKDTFPQNQQGKLMVSISGQGNFIQFGAPPAPAGKGIDFFEPAVKDELNKETAPEEGRRVFEYSFTTDSTGGYFISPVTFAFFDIAAKSFKVISSDSLSFMVAGPSGNNSKTFVTSYFKTPIYRWLFFLLFAVVIGVMPFLYLKGKRKSDDKTIAYPKRNFEQEITGISGELTDKQTCFELLKILSDYARINEAQLTDGQRQVMQSMRNDCHLMLYSDINVEGKKEEFKKRALGIVNETSP